MKSLLDNFLLALLSTAYLLSSPLQAQEKLPGNYKAPYSEPPKLELKFEDDFRKDSRGDYQISGKKDAVAWEQGQLSLGDGAILQRKLNAGSWLEMELDLEFPELTEDGQTSEFKVWLDFEDATDSFVWFRQKREEGKTRSAIFIVDTKGEWSSILQPGPVAKPLVVDGQLGKGKWSIRYRHGLWSLNDPTDIQLFGYIANGHASIRRAIWESGASFTNIEFAKFRCLSRTDFQPTPEIASKIEEANKLGKELMRLYQSGQIEKAIEIGKSIEAIRRVYIGPFHPHYASSLNNLAGLYKLQGYYDKAEPLFVNSKELFRKVFGKDHPDFATSLNNLAVLYESTGDYEKAEPLLAESLTIVERVFGKNHPNYATSLNNLAGLYKLRGEYDLAEPLFVNSMQIVKQVFGQDHPDYAISLNNLAGLYHARGDYGRAEELYVEAMNIREKALGKNHPDYATSLNNLAGLFEALGAYDKAEALSVESMKIRKKVLGKDHPDYATSLDSLAGLYYRIGDFGKAEQLFIEAKMIQEKVLGQDHPDYARSLNNLAKLYEALGNYDKSESLLVKAKLIQEKVLGKGHPDYAASLGNLAGLYKALGDFDKAEPLLAESMGIVEKVFGKNHLAYATSLNNLAGLYEAIGEYDKAAPLRVETTRIVENAFGKDHSNYATSVNNLAGMYRALGDYDKAEPLFVESNKIFEKVWGKDHPAYATSLNNLADFYDSLGDFGRAEPLYVESLEIFEEVLGKDHPHYAIALSNLALLYKLRGDYSRAEPLYVEAKKILEKVLGKDHPNYANSLNNLAGLYESLGEYEKAEPLYRTALEITRRNFDRFATIQGGKRQQEFVRSFEGLFSGFVCNALRLENRGLDTWKQAIQWKGISLLRQKRYQALSQIPETRELVQKLKQVKSRLSRHLQRDPTSPNWKQHKTELLVKEEELEKEISRLAAELGIRSLTDRSVDFRLPVGAFLIDFRRFTYSEPDPKKPGRFQSEPHYLAQIRRADNSVEMLDLGSAEKIEDAISRWRSPIERANQDGRTIDVVEQKAMDKAGLEIRKLLWEPLEEHIADTELVIVSPDGALGRLPLIALPGKKPGTFLLEEKKIVYLAVPALLPGMLEKPASSIKRSTRALLVGDIDYGKGAADLNAERLAQRNLRILQKLQFSALKNSGQEIDGIQTLFDQATKLSSSEATEQALQQQLKDHSVLHIATHGFFQSPDRFMKNLPREATQSFVVAREQAKVLTENPNLLSGLALADANAAGSKEIDEGGNDGILYSAEIAMLPMEHVELAVLSACETSLGTDDNPGEGLIGIQRAFQVAGARSTVASYWKVNDKATQMLMNRFYKNLIEYSEQAKAKNQDPNSTTVRIDALRDAQLWMLRGLNKDQVAQLTRGPDDKTKVKDIKLNKSTHPKSSKAEYISHPRYWAAFVLSGDWR